MHLDEKMIPARKREMTKSYINEFVDSQKPNSSKSEWKRYL